MVNGMVNPNRVFNAHITASGPIVINSIIRVINPIIYDVFIIFLFSLFVDKLLLATNILNCKIWYFPSILNVRFLDFQVHQHTLEHKLVNRTCYTNMLLFVLLYFLPTLTTSPSFNSTPNLSKHFILCFV
jgi:hypothetical protein